MQRVRKLRLPLVFKYISLPLLKLVYRHLFSVMMQDASWQEALFGSVPNRPKSRLLLLGHNSASVGCILAARFPDLTIVAADPSTRSIKKASRVMMRRNLTNLTLVEAPNPCLPFPANSFDAVILLLALHNRVPDEKLVVSREILRVLRHGGRLQAVDFDKPASRREHTVLWVGQYISDQSAIRPHIDGSWTQCFSRAGFVGIRREASHSVTIARISAIRARKR